MSSPVDSGELVVGEAEVISWGVCPIVDEPTAFDPTQHRRPIQYTRQTAEETR